MSINIAEQLYFQIQRFAREGVVDYSRLRVEMSRERFDTYRAEIAPWEVPIDPRMPTFCGLPVDVVSVLPEPGYRVIALAP